MATGKITKRSVEGLKPAEGKEVYLWDSDLKGFGVKLTPKGKRVYLIQYKTHVGKTRTRRVTIGPHGVLTADQARERARALLGEVAAGRDPAEAKDKARNCQTFEELLDQFAVEHVKAKLKASTAADYQRSMKFHIPANLLKRPIIEISHTDVSKLHQHMQSTPYQANRTIAMLSKFFNWCEQNGHRDNGSNPCRHIKRYKEQKRERFLSPEELSRLSRALKDAEKEQTATPWSIAAIRLLIFTGARLNEILTLKWEYVDFDLKQIRLPDSKTGRKSIYLNDPALDLLAGVPRTEGNPFVICGARKGRNLVNLQKPWRRIRSAAGLDDVRLHDLRHTFASFGAIGGISLPIIGGLVGHSQPGTTARYAHLSNDPLMAASNAIGSEIAKAMRQDGK